MKTSVFQRASSPWLPNRTSVVLIVAASLAVPATAQAPLPGETADFTLGPATAVRPANVPLPAVADGEKGYLAATPAPSLEPRPDAVLQEIFFEGFEGLFPGPWTVSDNNGLLGGEVFWDDTAFRSDVGSWSAWCADGGANASPPGGNYSNDMNSWMVFGPFNLSDAVGGSLSFRYWNVSEQGFDFLQWMVSANGTNFFGVQTSGNSNGWRSAAIDFTAVPGLGDVTGDPTVWIAFAFVSDGSITFEGAYIDEVRIVKDVGQQTGCVETPTALCLSNDRFRVTATWATPRGDSGVGNVIELTEDTGYFWFFDQDNVELVVKVLNTCSFFDRFWVFAGGLTNVEVRLRVEDTGTGNVKTYFNPPRTPFQPIQDTDAFATCP